MRRLLLVLAWMSLVSPACGDADRDLPREYRAMAVPAARLASADAVNRGGDLFQKCTARSATACAAMDSVSSTRG